MNIKEEITMAYEELMDEDISYAMWIVFMLPCFWVCFTLLLFL